MNLILAQLGTNPKNGTSDAVKEILSPLYIRNEPSKLTLYRSKSNFWDLKVVVWPPGVRPVFTLQDHCQPININLLKTKTKTKCFKKTNIGVVQ